MPGRKGSKNDKNKKGGAQQKEQDKGKIPPVPKSPDSEPLTIKSEGACGGRSSTAEDSEYLEESLYDGEEADGTDSKQASGGHKKSWKCKFGLRKSKEKEKKKQDKGQNEKKEQQERSGSASHSKRSDKRTSQSSQHPPSLSEAPPPQRHHTHSESSQGGHTHANIQDASIEEGAKQASPEVQGVRKI